MTSYLSASMEAKDESVETHYQGVRGRSVEWDLSMLGFFYPKSHRPPLAMNYTPCFPSCDLPGDEWKKT